MGHDRYAILGLARPRAEWFRAVSHWATSAALPAEFLKCVSVEEVRARLGSGRTFSALLVDGSLTSVDRDLLDSARQAGCVVLVVDDNRRARDWIGMGAAGVLIPPVTREELLDTLATHATMVGGAAARHLESGGSPGAGTPVGSLVAVCGPGGTGASTVAAALCQGLGAARRHGDVLLADFALNAEQAMLHDVRDVAPGVQELVEAHRSRWPDDDEVRSLTFRVVERGYHLLLGLRRARYWSTLRPRAFDAAFESLRRCFGVVVCDVTGDFEGEAEGGSADIEERNLMARTSVQRADVVLAVGHPGAKGLHSLVRVMADVAAAGVPAGRIVPVLNRAPRHPRARAELTMALADLAAPAMSGGPAGPPVFLPSRRVEDAVRDAVALPAPLPATLAGAFDAALSRLGPVEVAAPAGGDARLVVPGSFGAWYSGGEPA